MGDFLVLEERMNRMMLETWSGLSEEEKVGIVEDVADVVKNMRSVTSSAIQSVDRSLCYPGLLFFDLDPRGPFHSDIDLWNAPSRTLHDPPRKSFLQQALQNLKSHSVKYEPYVLTHCNISVSDNMVKDGKLVGILDWKCAAYYPVWYEYISASRVFTEMDGEWKGLLRERLDGYEGAKAFWGDLFHLREYPGLYERRLGGGLCSQ